MKRAEVWRFRFGPGWYVSTHYEEPPKRRLPIGERPVGAHLSERFATHAAALAHALAEVGLTKKNTEKETPMEHDDQQCSNPETLCDDCLYYGAQENR